MADATNDTPAARIAAAIAGRNPKAHAGVLATDLGAVAGALAPASVTEVTRALAKGAAGALKGVPPGQAAGKTCFVGVADLGLLLEAAGAHAQ